MHNDERSGFRTLLAAAVHFYTATGIAVAFGAAIAIIQNDYRLAFVAMFVAVVIDATDGTLARAAEVRKYTPWMDGRKLDDIVDYVNYSFLPILLIWHAGWLPEPVQWICVFPLIASSFAFAHEGAKEETRGFFRGFPSYWNVVAFYFAVLLEPGTESWLVAATLVLLSVLCVAPICFVYPNRPPCWKPLFLGGAVLWSFFLIAMLVQYPRVAPWLIAASLVYPAFYVVASIFLDLRTR